MDINTRDSYDEVAEEYALRIFHELDHKPLDRTLLERLVREVGETGPICDMGCGPGQIACYLQQQGATVTGIDLSPRMIEVARRLNPDIPFSVGDMTSLAIPDESWGGIAAMYSLIHIPPQDMATVLREFWRVLRPGGILLLSFHRGQEVKHFSEWWGKTVSVDFRFFEREQMEAWVQAAGFKLIETIERGPYENVEAATHRVYIFCQKDARNLSY